MIRPDPTEPLVHVIAEGKDMAQARKLVKDYKAIVAGHHLLGQLLRDFPYLRKRHEHGQLRLPFAMPTGNPFEMSKLSVLPQST